MMFRCWGVFTLAFALSVGLLMSGCGTDHTQYRVVLASNDSGNIDAAVDGKTVVTNLAFGEASPGSGYLTVATGHHTIEIRPTGTTTDLVNSSVSAGQGRAYTFIVSGFVTPPNEGDPGIAVIVLTDDHSAAAGNSVKLRVAHVAPDLSTSLNVYIVPTGTDITGLSPTIPSLTYGQASLYRTPAAGSVEVIVTETTDQVPIIDQTFDLSAGQNRTVLLLDNGAGGGNLPSFVTLADLN
ncbi:MAG TPA: DUF4397 domain-containing protein [Terriglobales bacterium]|nr:DUF4397 domain-containing protein [Terriglobales bacterium]